MHILSQNTTATITQEYAREQETAAAAAAAKAARERRRLTALEVDAALKDLLARQAVVCAKHDVLQQIAVATTATSPTSSSSRRPSGRRSMDGISSSRSTNASVIMSAPTTLSDAADVGYSFAAADAASAASTATDGGTNSSSSSSRRTQSMDLAKMLSGGWNPVTATREQQSGESLSVVADVADEETAETETADTAVTAADREPVDTDSEYVVVPLPPSATDTTDTAASTTAVNSASPPAVPTSDGSGSVGSTTPPRKRSGLALATDSNSLSVNSSVFSSTSGAPGTPSRSAGPCVSSLVQARMSAEAEAASKRAAAVSERLASAQYKESGARG
jgi:hypothetical protein